VDARANPGTAGRRRAPSVWRRAIDEG
jgi:hypothetical protein